MGEEEEEEVKSKGVTECDKETRKLTERDTPTH